MANLLDQNPWVLDTAGGGVIVVGKVFPRTIRWVGATTAGHQVVIQDSNGKVVWASEAAGANYVESDRVEIAWDGLDLVTLGSGKVYIEHA